MTERPDPAPGRLVLVRHGETEGNVAKILDTRVPGLPLTERGVAQAKSFGTNLSAPPRRLFCSTALRARQTAAHIESVTGVAAESIDGLYEVQVGDLEGLNSEAAHETFQRVYRAWHRGDLQPRVPGGETGQEVLDRYLPALENIRTRYLSTGTEPGDILLVSHGAAMRLVARVIADIALPFATNNHLDNTETIELAPRYADSGAFLGWDCTRWGRYTPPFDAEAEPTADDPMG